MNYFLSCNSRYIQVPYGDGQEVSVSEKTKNEYLKQSIQSGFIIDQENDIYIRKGYGPVAPVGPIGPVGSTIE